MEKRTIVKKVYLKPRVEFVDFSLAGSIAATCVYQGNHDNGMTCGYNDNGWIRFAPNGVCTFPIDDEFCYHVPTADNSVFGS